MRTIEQRAEADGTPITELAQRAGRSLANTVLQHWPDRDCLILAGPGKNGGDGEIAASLLNEHGVAAALYTFRRPAGPHSTSAEHDPDFQVLRSHVRTGPVVLDCLLGTGATRPPEGKLSELIRIVNDAGNPVLAADIPTGVNPDSGAVSTVAVRADRTLAFGFAKVGDVVYPGAEYAGTLTVDPLGISPALAADVTLRVTGRSDVAALLPPRSPDSNKGTYGRVLVIGGSRDFPSAPGLSSIAALRAGAGLAEAAVLPLSQQVIAAHALEPIYTVLPDDDGHIAVEAAAVIRSVLPSSDAAVFGPGMGVTDATLHLTRELLSELRNADTKPAVIDADGLNALSRLPGWWTDLPTLVLTPHPGEMSRLTSLSIAEIQSDRVAVARRFAAEWRSIVVLKGAGTVIAHPDGRARINPTGGPNLATGGTGDVLSGIIGGLLAQRLTPWDAAVAGVFLHGLAGDRVAGRLGDAGTLAGDLLHEIPKARAALHEGERRA